MKVLEINREETCIIGCSINGIEWFTNIHEIQKLMFTKYTGSLLEDYTVLLKYVQEDIRPLCTDALRDIKRVKYKKRFYTVKS